jgi:hypothetical protein
MNTRLPMIPTKIKVLVYSGTSALFCGPVYYCRGPLPPGNKGTGMISMPSSHQLCSFPHTCLPANIARLTLSIVHAAGLFGKTGTNILRMR